jgi:excisionase family DNA binding protein
MPDLLSDAPRPERSLFIDDAARLLGVSRRTVYYRIREGRLRTIRTRCGSQRVLMASVETLLGERRTSEPPGTSGLGAS